MSVGLTGEAVGPTASGPGQRRSRWPLWVAALILLGAVLVGWRLWAQSRTPQYGIVIDAAEPAQDFMLQGSNGRRVSLAEFRGKPVLLYFGYTTCPDVCPTTLADLRMAMQALGNDQEQVQVLFVSVDPERDTAERLQAYLQYFNPNFIGLTGSLAEVEAIASRFGVYFAKNEANSAADYLVDHTSAVLLLDADGRLRLMFPYGTTGEQLAHDTKVYIQ